MSKIEFCLNGGMDGIRVSDAELDSFGDAVGTKALDAYIPLPNVPKKEQLKRIKECKDHDADTKYWERDNGKHGWCCSHCGTSVQWG